MANREIIVEKIAHLQEIDVASDLAINAPGTVTFSSDVAVTNTLTAAILTATNYVSTNEVVSPSGQNLILVADQQLNLTATSDSMTLQTLGAGKNIVLSPASGAVVAFTGNLDMTTNSLLNVSSISSAANLTLSPASGNLLVAASIEPTTDNTNALGSSGNQWSAVNTYTVTNTAATSNLVLSTASGNVSLQPSTSVVDVNGSRIVNVATPTSTTDAVNKLYADSLSAGLNPKEAVLVATTADLGATYATSPSNGQFTAAPSSIDGVALPANARVLVKDQTDPKQNGIYVYDAANQLTRSADMDGSPAADAAGGDYTFVQAGTTWAGYGFNTIWPGLITLNTDPVNWSQFSGGSNLANRDLSNLVPTAINQSLIPNANNTFYLGSPSLQWSDVYVASALVGADTAAVVDTAGRRLINAGGAAALLDFSGANLVTNTNLVPDTNLARSLGAFGNQFAGVFSNLFYSSANPVVFGSGSVDGLAGSAGYGIQVFADGAGLQANVNGGNVQIQTSDVSGTGNAGNISLLSGNAAATGLAGNIVIQAGTNTVNLGNVLMSGHQVQIDGASNGGQFILSNFSSTNFSGLVLSSLADPVNPQDAATKAYVDSGAAAANRYLSNLLSPTAINQDLLPGSAFGTVLGNSSVPFGSVSTAVVNLYNSDPANWGQLGVNGTLPTGGGADVYFASTFSTIAHNLGIYTAGATDGSNAGSIAIQTGYATAAGAGGNMSIRTGNSTGGLAGTIELSTGDSDTTGGNLYIYVGQTPTVPQAGGITIDASGNGAPGLAAAPGQIQLVAPSNGVLSKADIIPDVSGTRNLGGPSNLWSGVYTGSLTGSGSIDLNPNGGGTGSVYLMQQSSLLFNDLANDFSVGFKAPATVAANVLWTLPGTDGTSGEALVTDGAGTLSWADISGTAANVNLSNLAAPTAINQALAFGAGINGSLVTADDTGSGSTVLVVGSGAAIGANNSGAVTIQSGPTVNGNSGQINISAGAPTGTGGQGAVVIGNGGSGQVLIETSVQFEVTAAASYFTGPIYPSNDITYNLGSTGLRFNQVFFNTMVDAAGVNEIDLTHRYLVDGNGVNAVQWGAGNRYLVDSGATAVLQWDAAANSGNIQINAHLVPTVTASYNLGSASAQFANIFTDVVESTTGLTLYAPGNQIVLQGTDVNVNSTNVINVLDPVNPQDAATKAYVDGSVASGGLWTKYTVDYTAISAAAPTSATGSVLIFNLAAKALIESVIVVPTAAFVSGAANVAVSVGNPTDTQKYATDYTVSGVTPGGSEFQDFTTSYSLENLTTATAINLYASVDSGVLGDLSAGSVDVYVKTSQLP